MNVASTLLCAQLVLRCSVLAPRSEGSMKTTISWNLMAPKCDLECVRISSACFASVSCSCASASAVISSGVTSTKHIGHFRAGMLSYPGMRGLGSTWQHSACITAVRRSAHEHAASLVQPFLRHVQ